MPSPDARFSLDGRVAIVTGASKGIGEAIARGLADAGAKVIVSSRKQEAVDEVAASIKDAGGEATGVACHVGKPEQLKALVDKALEAYGRIDILVNNAATNPVFGMMMDVDEAAFNKIFAVNVRAPMELAKLCHPHMHKGGAGSVINISSIGGVTPEPGLGVYSASKAALISLTKVMAKEWGSDGIRANVICPGLIKTKFSQALWMNDDITEMAVGSQPIARIGETDELAGMALFLASDASSYCTGAVYMVDGGHCL
jgi:dehydrogenase/reductase SDR family protein 4